MNTFPEACGLQPPWTEERKQSPGARGSLLTLGAPSSCATEGLVSVCAPTLCAHLHPLPLLCLWLAAGL